MTRLTAKIRGLNGKSILITRQEEQSTEFIAEVKRRGGRAVLFPLIKITDPDTWTDCDQALSQISSYDAIVFTSTNGVEKFLGRCEGRGFAIRSLRSIAVYAVGKKTQREIEEWGLSVKFVPEIYSAESLAQHFKSQGFKHKKVLMPRGSRGRQELVTALTILGAVVDVVVVYKNIEPDLKGRDDLVGQLANGKIDVITLASPSAVTTFSKIVPAKKLSTLGGKALLAVIGPTTREAAEQLGYRVDIVGTQATVEGLVDAIAEKLTSDAKRSSH